MKTEHMCVTSPPDYGLRDLFDEIEGRVHAHRFTFGDEKALQLSLMQLLGDFAVYREFTIDGCRFDLALDVIEGGSVVGKLVIEVKQDGSAAEWLRQCSRYSELPEVVGVILITTKPTGCAAIGFQSGLNGKPFRAVLARRAAW